MHDIVHRAQTGKLIVSSAKQDHIEKTFANHMGKLGRGFESADLNKDLLCTMDETHFVTNCGSSRSLGFHGDTEVKYTDVVSGSITMTMMVYITGGSRA